VGENPYIFDQRLNKKVPDILRELSDDRPSTVFCHSKKDICIAIASSPPSR